MNFQKESKEIALYVRSATKDPHNTESSVERQIVSLYRFCSSMGWNQYHTYIDEGYSGENSERPAFSKLMKYVQQRKIGTVIVTDLARLARPLDNLFKIINFLHRKKISLITLQEYTERIAQKGTSRPNRKSSKSRSSSDLARCVNNDYYSG